MTPTETLTAPVAARRPHVHEIHDHRRQDDYFWLNRREDPEVIAYLEAENAYTEARTAHTKSLREELFEEIKGRIKQDDSTVPYLEDGHYYYSRYVKGGEYPLHCRRTGSPEADEQILLDGMHFERSSMYRQRRWQ